MQQGASNKSGTFTFGHSDPSGSYTHGTGATGGTSNVTTVGMIDNVRGTKTVVNYNNNKGGGGGGGRRSCFLADELVLTKDGYKEISKIKVGDKVLSYNEKTKKNEYARVIYTYEHLDKVDNIYSIKVNNSVIEASTDHPFYVKSNDGFKMVKSKDLKVGDMLFDSNGNYYSITEISVSNSKNDLYNLEVEKNHNYYVSNSNILVHNKK